MKKLLYLLIIPFVAFIYSTAHNKINAAGGFYASYTMSASSSTATADGSAAVTMTVYSYTYNCPDPDYRTGGYAQASDCPSGGGYQEPISISGISPSATGSGWSINNKSLDTAANGYATFTITSTVAETKTVQIYANKSPGDNQLVASKSITFTAPQTAAQPTQTTNQPAAQTISPKAPAINTSASEPAAPTVDKIVVNNQENVPGDKIIINEGETFKIKGKALPNATVNVYIFSEPKKYTVQADGEGNWSLEVKDLPQGDHHAEAEVVDLATGKTSARANLLAFTVGPPLAASTADTASNIANSNTKSHMPPIVGLGIVGLVGLLVLSIKTGFIRKLIRR